MAPQFQLNLLGGFRLLDAAGRERPLPSRRACALLACLGLEAPTSRAELAERLWPGLPPTAARRNLRRELARLRDAGLQDLLAATSDPLALAPSVQTDIASVQAAIARGDFAAALAPWCGALLAGFVLSEAPAFESWLQPRRDGWAQRWREAALAHAERLERSGALRDALQWHVRLRTDDPLQEEHHRSVMRLHHRLGEPAAALQAYAQCAALLRAELGVSPAPATLALAERLQAAERLAPQLAGPPSAPPEGFDLPLVGRVTEAHALATARRPVLLVLGEPGVGKTRLVQDTLRAATTLAMPCAVETRHSALYPVSEALHAALASPLHAERLSAAPASARREAARLLPALLPATPPAGVAPQGVPAGRERLYESLADVIDALATPAGTLWIDDLHEADDATLELLALLAHRHGQAPGSHVRIVAAARPQELEARPQAADLVRRLQRAGLLQRLPLQPFGPGETLDLVRAVTGSADGATFAQRLQQATQGNAFHIVETLHFLLGSGEVQVQPDGRWCTRYDDASAGYARLPVPPTLVATVIERVARLTPAARQLVDAAVLTRRGFTLAQLQPATALDDWAAVDGLEEALRLHLFTELEPVAPPGRPATALPRYRLAHELAREALVPTLRPERRRLIHARLAEALIAQHEAADHVAWHLDEAGQPAQALPWHLAAAEEARRVSAWSAVVTQLDLAWPALADGEPAVRLQCLRRRIEAAKHGFDLQALAQAIDDLQAEGRSSGNGELELESLVLRADLGQLQKHPLPAVEPLRTALAAGRFAHLPSLQARAYAALATALLAAGQVDAARQALSGAPSHLDDPAIEPTARAALLAARANAARLAQQPEQALPMFERALALLTAPADVDARLQTRNLLAHTQYMLGRADEAIATLEAVLAEAQQGHLTAVLRTVLPNLATLNTVHGRLPQARHYLERGMRELRSVDNPATHAALQLRLAELELTEGRLGAALAAARGSIARYEANGGGSQDYAPWVLCTLVMDFAGASLAAEQRMADLLRSPARAPGPGPEALVHLRTLVCRLTHATPAQAGQIADELLARRVAPDAAYPTTEADFWRAEALCRAGRAAEALALAQTLPETELGLLQHGAALWALRLRAARAAALLDDELPARAAAAWTGAPALPALDLATELMHAHAARGETGASAAWAARARSAADALARSLDGEPDLAADLLRRWRPAARR